MHLAQKMVSMFYLVFVVPFQGKRNFVRIPMFLTYSLFLGYVPSGEEIEPEGEESESSEKNNMRKSLQISEVHNDIEEQYPDHVTPITPFQICR